MFGGGGNLVCPRVDTLVGAERITQFLPGPGRDLTDIEFEGTIAKVRTDCDYDRNGFVEVSATIDMVFSRGPASRGDSGRFEYFVAISGPGDEIIDKQNFVLDVPFTDGAMRVAAREEITQEFSHDPDADARRYRIFIGFQLTREQLDYQRARR